MRIFYCITSKKIAAIAILFLFGIFYVILPIYRLEQALRMGKAVKAMSQVLFGQTVVIDAGHGGVDDGAKGCSGAKEDEINLQIALALEGFLREAGVETVMIRDGDYDLSERNSQTEGKTRKRRDLEERVRIVNSNPQGILISIHCNSIPSGRWHGAQTFYFNGEESYRLAKAIQEEIIHICQNTDRVVLQKREVFLLENSKIPTALVEVGFLSNAKEERMLKEQEYQRKMAFAIFSGISQYFLSKDDS